MMDEEEGLASPGLLLVPGNVAPEMVIHLGNSSWFQFLVPTRPPPPQLSELGSLQPLRETDPCTYCLFLQRSGHELHRILPPSSRDARASQAHISLGAWALSLQGCCSRLPVSNYSSCSPLFLLPEGGSCLLW